MDSLYIFLFPIWMGYSFAWQIKLSTSLDNAIATKREGVGKLYLAKAGSYIVNLAGLFGFLAASGRNVGDIRYSAAILVGVFAYLLITKPMVKALFSQEERKGS